jgi:hypothetical protein
VHRDACPGATSLRGWLHDDLRLGLDLVVQEAADFTGSGSATISGNQLGWMPTDTSLGAGVTLGGTATPASPGLGSTAAVLASAHAGSGTGTSALVPVPDVGDPGHGPTGLVHQLADRDRGHLPPLATQLALATRLAVKMPWKIATTSAVQ